MSNITNFDHAGNIFQEAIDDETVGLFTEECQRYRESLDFFKLALKDKNDEKAKHIIKEKITGHLYHLEALRVRIIKDNGRLHGSTIETPRQIEEVKDDNDDMEITALRSRLAGVVSTERPYATWDDVVGLEAAKYSLKETVLLPIKFPHLFTGMRGAWSCKGILLYGPPGTGKSLLVKVIAAEAKCAFFSLRSIDLVDKSEADSVRLVKDLFQLARKCRPAIIFIDEIDSLTRVSDESEREKSRAVKTEFLVQMASAGNTSDDSKIFVLGATNLPWEVDLSVKRRFTKRLYIPLPGPEERRLMFEKHIGAAPSGLTPEDLRKVVDQTEGYSGFDISIIARCSLIQPFINVASATHFKQVVIGGSLECAPCSSEDPCAEKCWSGVGTNARLRLEQPSTMADFSKFSDLFSPFGEVDIKQYQEWTERFGHHGA